MTVRRSTQRPVREDAGDLLLVGTRTIFGLLGDWQQSHESWAASRYDRRHGVA